MIDYFMLTCIVILLIVCLSSMNMLYVCYKQFKRIENMKLDNSSETEKISFEKLSPKDKQNHRLAVDSNAYFRFLYDYSPIGVLRIRYNGLSENYNQRLSQIFSKMITMYGESMDSIVCYVVAHSLYEIFDLNNASKIKNIKMSKMINFVELDQILKIDVLIEYDYSGHISHFNFFVNDDVDTLINNRDNVEEYRFFKNAQSVKENFKTVKTEMISKIFDVKVNNKSVAEEK